MLVVIELEREVIQNGIELTDKELERGKIVEKKRLENTFQVAFCGHFSAGKSTILNHLLGAEMLPTSPIPTSANIIGIKNGELGLTVETTEGKNKNWTGEIPWERVREWGMNGGEIASLTIEAPLPFLGEKSVIYDTPGVDSTDPTHQAVTMEALYTTDFIVYVTDYNHVQSETNLTFLKQLSDENKPIYMVINQIDKHDDHELSFQSFDQSVRETFSDWGIQLLKLCYTSMKVENHRLNQLNEFEKDIKSILFQGQELLSHANQRIQQGYFLSILQRLQLEKDEEIDQIKEQMKAEGHDLQLLNTRESLANSYEKSLRAKQNFEEELEASVYNLVKDVTIFPYTTTELTRNWLESTEPHFKVGFLLTKKKTEEERGRRLQKLIDEVNDKVKTQLQFHFHRLFQTIDFTLLSNRQQVENALQELQLTIEPEFFIHAVQPGPKSREYVYSFTKDRTAAIVKEMRKKTTTVIHLLSCGMENHWKKEQLSISKKLEELRALDQFVHKIKDTEKNYGNMCEHMTEMIEQFQDAGAYEDKIIQAMKKDIPIFQKSLELSSLQLPSESVIDTSWKTTVQRIDDQFNENDALAWVERLKQKLQPYVHHDRMVEERQSLLKRIEKFEQQTFTISLFGAFSAGKSSFANALLGENILPVSPHPTTATVNTVKQSEEGHPTRTAVVHLKTKDQLNEEIQSVAEQLDIKLSIETIHSWKANTEAVSTSWQKTYHSYLLTLKNSLNEGKWELGSTIEIDLEELQPFVANEHQSCLVDQVTLYYDCSLTKKGIILVDTPGVNSIHGRHTNVAFKQLRDSDAIFYVSYYNHSFSKADQLFLQQMAKVNEGFRTDKLYFILNAADLASSEAELNGVCKHVNDQLKQCGIDQPRLYPLSSKRGLEGKQSHQVCDPLFTTFENEFYQQTISELKRLSFELLRDETKRYVNILANGLELMNSEESTKKQRRDELKKEVQQWVEKIEIIEPLNAYQTTTQEVNELFLYLRERVRFVIGDYFQDHINVATVVGSNKKAQQQALYASLKEWRSEGENFLQQEIQATFVRVEIALYRAIDRWINETIEEIRIQFPAFTTSVEFDKQELQKQTTRYLPIALEEYISSFHSLKTFFEQQQVRLLKDELVSKGTELASQTLKQQENETVNQLKVIFDQMIQQIKSQLSISLQRELDRFDALMDPKHYDVLSQEHMDLEFIYTRKKSSQ